MDELSTRFPDDMKWAAPYDPTVFVRDSIRAVVQTLLEAVVLVVLVVILFLQTWASIIPLIAVPVSVVGTFSILYPLGFSLNTLSLFGLVLAIGIVGMMPSWWWRTSSEISKRGSPRLRRRIRRCVKCPGQDYRHCAGAVCSVCADGIPLA